MVGLIVLTAGCSERSNEQIVNTDGDSSATTSPAAQVEEAGIPYSAAADPKATYRLLSVKPGEDGNIIAMTQRIGPSGTSYSNREINCRAQLARYIGEGDTREEAERPSSNPANMAPLLEGSSTHAAVQAACAKS